MMLKKVFYALKPMERSASLQNVATTSYATITGSPREQRDPRLRTRTQQKTPETPRGPFDKAHRSPVKTPEAPKPFCRPPKRQQDPEDEPSTAGRSIRQKIDDVGTSKINSPNATRPPTPTPVGKEKSTAKYPPLVVESMPNWDRHFQKIREKIGRYPNARPYRSGIRFLPTSEEEYRAIQKYLSDTEEPAAGPSRRPHITEEKEK
ncbi:hypothetical protein ACJJTC_016995 [Scirpophaga incertulas]